MRRLLLGSLMCGGLFGADTRHTRTPCACRRSTLVEERFGNPKNKPMPSYSCCKRRTILGKLDFCSLSFTPPNSAHCVPLPTFPCKVMVVAFPHNTKVKLWRPKLANPAVLGPAGGGACVVGGQPHLHRFSHAQSPFSLPGPLRTVPHRRSMCLWWCFPWVCNSMRPRGPHPPNTFSFLPS